MTALPAPPPKNSYPILVAEDDPSSRRLLEGLLTKLGYVHHTCSNGQQAWQQLQQPQPPRLLLLDWLMPEMDGLELLYQIRHQFDTAPPYVIMLTGKTGKKDIVTALDAGANDYIIKSVIPQELRARIDVGFRVLAAQDRLQEQLDFSQRIFDSTEAHIALIDPQGTITHVNKAWRDFALENHAGPEDKWGVGANYYQCWSWNFVDATNTQQAHDGIRQVQQGQLEHFAIDFTCHSPDQKQWFSLQAVPLMEQKGHVIVSHTDITSRKEAENTIWRQAHLDDLSELPNQLLFKKKLAQALEDGRANQQQVALLFLDLDNFKEVNEALGHSYGDRLIQEAAKRLQHILSPGGILARFGGDEFTLLTFQTPGTNKVGTLIEGMQQAINQPFYLHQERIYTSVSIGIALYPDNAADAESLFAHADLALHSAKEEGRNRCVYFSSEMQQSIRSQRHLLNELHNALPRQQLQMYLQPIIHLASGSIHKAEALMRWQHPQQGFISPGRFIPLAEKSGLIVPLGGWIIQQALQAVEELQACHHPAFQISVNKSPRQFRDSSKEHSCLTYLERQQAPGNSLVLEITESLFMEDRPQVKERMTSLRQAGVQMAMDDFGTGYSSLAYLKSFDLDYLKIDGTFVRNLDQDSDNHSLCEAIIAMAHKLGLNVIAEGVETQEQQRILETMGCDYAQGFLFARPMPVADFKAMLGC